MNKKKGIKLLQIFLLISLLFGLVAFIFSANNKPNEITSEQLLNFIQEQKVANISIQPDNGVYVVSGITVTDEQIPVVQQIQEKNNELVNAKQNGDQVKVLQLQQEIQQLNQQITKASIFSKNAFKTKIIGQEYQVQQITQALDQQQIPYNVKAYKAPFDWFGFIMQMGLLLFLGSFVFSMMRGKAPGIDQKDFSPKVPNIRFKDVIGYPEEKQELSELVDFLKNPKKYRQMGAKLPKGVLLEGPPGTGKTLMAKAVAGESNVPFFAASGSDFDEMYVGVGAGRIRKLFKDAKKNAPAIIFIDEIDAIGKRDSGKNAAPGINQTINSLLVEMDGFESDDADIIVMAATNKKDHLDDALLRPGRFDRQIMVDLPTVDVREDILKYHLRNKNVAKNIDMRSIARSTTGMSGAQLAAVANESALLAVRERKNEINQQMLQESVDRVLMGPAKISNKYSEHDKKVVSYHESGHCIVGLELEGALEVQKITIIPRRDAGGYVSYIPNEEEERFVTRKQLLDRLTSLVAGRVSEELFIGEITVGAFNDFEQATNIARAMVTKYGMCDELGVYQYEANGADNLSATKQYSDTTADKIDHAIKTYLDNAKQQAKEILLRRKDDIELLAKTIREKEVLDKEQIDYLIKYRMLPQDDAQIYQNNETTTKDESNKNDDEKPSSQSNENQVVDKDGNPAKWPINDDNFI